MRIRHLALLPLFVLVLIAAGCGGDGDSAAVSTTATETETVSTETTGEESTSTDETTAVADAGDLSEECLSFASVGAKYAQAFQDASSAGASGDLSQVTDVFDEFAKEAPEEIRGDLETIAENIGQYAEALKGLDLTSGGVPSADQLQKLQELSKDFNGADMQQASSNIEAWVTENCSNG